VTSCPACGAENPEGFKFCGQCGAVLTAPPAIAEERKTVTTLFCDLVSFTAMSEAADPEDVDALLRDYFVRATRVIESHGGTVEKFIGDAVVGVFGVPAVHEDDPERAVRAALRILEALEGMTRPDGTPLQARCGVNTGEALVRLDVDPSSGAGFLTGDAVNTAARLEAAATPGGVCVGALTHELTERVIVYEELPAVTAKGKSEPVTAWRALRPHARTGLRSSGVSQTPFIGRAVELSYLMALLDKAVDSSSAEIVMVIGEPGIGKSRLVAELFARVDAGARMITWRQARSLPYGDGSTFWALAEIVKEHAGILDSDDLASVEDKLEQVLPEGEDRPWFRQRLRALLGLEAPSASQEENFTAWLRFLEDMAFREPVAIVLEDLQWADSPLLDFVEFLALHVAHVPLLIVATTRPELFERHPSFAAAAARINRIVLDPLSDGQTEELIASSVDALADDLRSSIVKVSRGNPFFAEESARLVRDHTVDGSQLHEVANSVQAVIAARLDSLEPELRATLGDAAVAGEVFWDGLLSEMREAIPGNAVSALDRLTAKQLVCRVRTSSMGGENEYAFAHGLTREVAYGRLPRLLRAKKHRAVAAWIEAKAGHGGHELVEILAHHYTTALELARDAGDRELEAELRTPALDYLTRAGERVLAVDVRAAERYCTQALDLTADGKRPPELLRVWANVLGLTERHRESLSVWREAVEALLVEGRGARAAQTMCEMSFEQETVGLPFVELQEEALELVRGDGPSPEMVTVAANLWGDKLANHSKTPEEVLAGVTEVLTMCRDLGLPPSPVAVIVRANARFDLGDEGCMEDLEQALEFAKAQGRAISEDIARFNSAVYTMEFYGAMTARETALRGLETSERRGNRTFARAFETQLVMRGYFCGEWDQGLEAARALEPVLLEAEDYFDLFILQFVRIWMLTSRGCADEAEPLVLWLREHVLPSRPEWPAAVAVASLAWHDARGELTGAHELFTEIEQYPILDVLWQCPNLVRWALRADERDWASRLLNALPSSTPFRKHILVTCSALLEESDCRHDAAAAGFADAADRWRDFGVPYEEGHALLGLCRCLLALGRPGGVVESLSAARDIFERLGAKPALHEAEALLRSHRLSHRGSS
jgi:class 3 adenylate cyclase